MHPSKKSIKREYYSNIFKVEANSILKVCSRLTKSNFELNNFSKMKVKICSSGEDIKLIFFTLIK
jgi:hypothetical protein